MIDQYSRYPEIEIITATTAQQTIDSLTKIFATHGLPYKVISDNGPPFTSEALRQYMKVNNIKHHRITPLHPKANATAENFMRGLNKTLRTALIERTPWITALYQFLQHYRNTPHASTEISPAEVMFKRKLRLKIPSIDYKPNQHALTNFTNQDNRIKAQMKLQVDKRYKAVDRRFSIGDYVLVQQRKTNKLSSRFDPKPYRITQIKGSMLSASRPGHKITRNKQHFKFLSRSVPLNYKQGGDNNDDDEFDDFDTDVTNKNHPTPSINFREMKQYPSRIRNRPAYFHEQHYM